jgi:hypothetical protein
MNFLKTVAAALNDIKAGLAEGLRRARAHRASEAAARIASKRAGAR